jgi:hypothetical protein
MQPDTAIRGRQAETAEPGNFEPARPEGARNSDASMTAAPERGSVDYDEINTQGSER